MPEQDPGFESSENLQKTVDRSIQDNEQKSKKSFITNYSGKIYKKLVAYLKFSVKGAKELCSPCIGRERNRLCEFRGDIQIS